MKRKLLFAMIACMLLTGCGQAAGSGSVSEKPKESVISGTQEAGSSELIKLGEHEETKIAPVQLENAYQRAAFLADQVYAANQGSTLVSPLSLEMALGLATEGASGETAKELYKYLGNENYADWAQQYMEYAESLESKKDEKTTNDIWADSKYSFCYELANSLWVRQDDKLVPAYQKLVEQKFHAQAENVDFVGRADETAGRINGWVDAHTHGMIQRIVDPLMFSTDLASILVNTVYFESPWVKKWSLMEHTFTDIHGNQTTQEMLCDTVEAYYENDQCTAFSKNYFNGFQFIGILPKKTGEFEISKLDLKSLMDSKTYDYDVKILAPKLDFDTTATNIVDILKAQGVNQAFDREHAEFDKLIEDHELHISDIIQKCKIEMDEEGTRAAAVTAIMMSDNCAMIEARKEKQVYLDRPFAFLIYDSVNDQIVFVGKVTELK